MSQLGRHSSAPPHLANAARALERILTTRWPEYAWVAHVREGDRDDSAGLSPTSLGQRNGSAMSQDPDPLVERNSSPTAAGALHHNGGEQRA